MTEPTKAQIKEFWGYYLQTKIEMRGGFRDECGDFCDMQENPYNNSPHKDKVLCYLKEARELSEEDRQTYEDDVKKGIAYFIPETSDWWEEVPDHEGIEALGFLFKYAAQKIRELKRGALLYETLLMWIQVAVLNPDEDPALALFWVLYEVRKNEK